MTKSLIGIIVGIIVLVVAAGVYFATRQSAAPTGKVPEITTPQPQAVQESTQSSSFQTQTFDNIKTPHLVSSEPANNAVLTTLPSQVTIKFNFNLAEGSKIGVSANDNDVTTAQGTKIAADKLSMTALINPVARANYKVNYTACWPDGSCHEGSFGFSVKTSGQ